MLPAGIAVKSLGMVSNPSQIVAEIGGILALSHKEGPPLPASPPPPPPTPVPASVAPVPVPVPFPVEVLTPEVEALELPPPVAPPAELLAPELGATELPAALELGEVDAPVPVPVDTTPPPVFVLPPPLVDAGAALVDDEPLPSFVVFAPGTLLSEEHAAIAATIGTAKHPNTDGTWKDLVNRILVTLFR